MWQMQSGFPKPVSWARERWFFPEVEQWLLALHGVGTVAGQAPIPLPGNKGETFDEALAARKAKLARRSKRTGPDLAPAKEPKPRT
jgi:hypothetical protein